MKNGTGDVGIDMGIPKLKFQILVNNDILWIFLISHSKGSEIYFFCVKCEKYFFKVGIDVGMWWVFIWVLRWVFMWDRLGIHVGTVMGTQVGIDVGIDVEGGYITNRTALIYVFLLL